MRLETSTQTGICAACEQSFAHDQTHCSCGRPTPFASFEDRAAYEVSAWRIHLERSASA